MVGDTPPPPPARVYRGDGIDVLWEPRFCIHHAACVRGLPGVFRPGERPWIAPENAPSADALANVVRRCPTGALHYVRTDGEPSERALYLAAMPDPSDAASVLTITPARNGPLLVTGGVRVVAADGTVLREAERVALCRCGASKTQALLRRLAPRHRLDRRAGRPRPASSTGNAVRELL